MGKVKEQKWNLIKSHLILMFMNIDIECPTNIDEITDYIFNEYPDWHTGNISTEFKGWVEAQSENVQDINTPTGHDNVLIPMSDNNIWSQIKAEHEDDDKIYVDAWLTSDDNENGEIIAKIETDTKNVVYFDQRARDDKYAQEVINERLKEL